MWPGVLVPRCLAFRQVGINLQVMVYNPNPRTRDEETDRSSEVTFDEGIPRDLKGSFQDSGRKTAMDSPPMSFPAKVFVNPRIMSYGKEQDYKAGGSCPAMKVESVIRIYPCSIWAQEECRRGARLRQQCMQDFDA